MKTRQIKSLIDQTLNISKKLVEGPNKFGDQFSKVLEAVCRRDYMALYSVRLLSDDLFCGDAVLDLSRKMLEDMINIEFMKLKGEEKMAQKFIDFVNVEHKNDLDFAIKMGTTRINEKVQEQIQADFKKVEKEFSFKNRQLARSWSKCSFEDMLEELVKEGIIKEEDKGIIIQVYNLGNRKNHLSSIDAHTYMMKALRDLDQTSSMETGLLFCLTSYLRVAIVFVSKLRNKKLEKQLKKIWDTMNISLKHRKNI